MIGLMLLIWTYGTNGMLINDVVVVLESVNLFNLLTESNYLNLCDFNFTTCNYVCAFNYHRSIKTNERNFAKWYPRSQ